MLFQSLLLFLSAALGGVAVLIIRKPNSDTFKQLLVLAGGYLFSITVLHLLPDLFALPTSSPRLVGLYILIGFFFQLLLELFSGGVEHGHMHEVNKEEGKHKTSPLMLLLALCIHAFLDGVILSSPASGHHHGHSHTGDGLLVGIILHKVPVAFAFASVLVKLIGSKRTIIGYLFVFALASPLGLWSSHYCSQHHLLSEQGLLAVSGIVSGSFLHIATTIFFEASPGHHHNMRKFMASLAGAGLAVIFEFFL
jgi:zinc transporter ZupT